MKTAQQQLGTTVTEDTYIVFYSDHKDGSPAGMMIRKNLKDAERTESLMWDCGYQHVDVRHAASIGEMTL